MLTRVGSRVRRGLDQWRWTNVYGLARTLLALELLGTMLFSPTATVDRRATGDPTACATVATQISMFCLSPRGQEWLPRLLAMVVLLVVASGWRPALTALPHWWVTVSFSVSSIAPDGGDQVAAVLTLMLLPIALTDHRRWHWQTAEATEVRSPLVRLLALSAWWAIRVQVFVIYFDALVGKLSVPEWVDGSALYYYLFQPEFGAPGWLRPLLWPILTSGLVVVMTWGTLLIELGLSLALVMSPRGRRLMLVVGLLFHAGIAVMMGLISFATVMVAALVLYLRPPDRPFSWPGAKLAWAWIVDVVVPLRLGRARAGRVDV